MCFLSLETYLAKSISISSINIRNNTKNTDFRFYYLYYSKKLKFNSKTY